MIKVKYIAFAAFIACQFGITQPSVAQSVFDSPEFQCVDRCYTEFKQCLGTPPDSTGEPPVLKCPDGPCDGEGTVPTPPPYDFCLAAKQQCEATCTISRLNAGVMQ